MPLLAATGDGAARFKCEGHQPWMNGKVPRSISRSLRADLERALAALARALDGAAVTRASLAAARMGHLWALLEPLATVDARNLARVLGAILSERAARPSARVELVWTGGEGKTAYARPTASVALLGSANFTDRGQSRNVEVGARIEDAGFAQALVGQFRAATGAGVFCAVEGRAPSGLRG